MKRFILCFVPFLLATTAHAQRDFMRTYANVYELLAANPKGAHNTAFISDLYLSGDNLGGMLRYDSTATDATNEWDVFKPYSFDGRWLRKTNNFGVKSLAYQETNNVRITGGTITGITDISTTDGGTGSSTIEGASKNLAVPQYVAATALANRIGSSGPILLLSTNLGDSAPMLWSPDGASRPPWSFRLDDVSNYGSVAIRDNGGTGYFLRNFDGRFTPQMFGAAVDGITDDTAAFQAWLDFGLLDSYRATWRGEAASLYVPPGRYLIQGTVSVVYEVGDGAVRNFNQLTIRGAGPNSSVFVTTRSDTTAMFYFQELRGFRIHDIGAQGPVVDAHTAQPWDGPVFLQTASCNEWVIENLSIQGFSIGLRLDNLSGNYGKMSQVDFDDCTTCIYGYGMQSGDYLGLRFTQCGVPVIARVTTGDEFQFEGEINYSSTQAWPAIVNLNGASGLKVGLGYYEGNDDMYILGAGKSLICTNSADATAGSTTTIRVPLDQYHLITLGSDVTVSGSSTNTTIQSDIYGTRTITGPTVRTNYIEFTADSVFADATLVGQQIVVAESQAGVRGLKIDGGRVDDNSTGLVTFGPVENLELGGSYTYGANIAYALNGLSNVIDAKLGVSGTNSFEFLGPTYSPLKNLWPDPEMIQGTNVFTASANLFGVTMDNATSYTIGRGGSIHVWANPALGESSPGSGGWARGTLPVDATSLVGRDLMLAYSAFCPQIIAYRPYIIGVTAGGSGYSNGEATITDGTNTVRLTLTTSAGAITAAAWKFGYFLSADTSTAFAVTQSGGSSGTVTMTSYRDDGWNRGNRGAYGVLSIVDQSNNTLGQSGNINRNDGAAGLNYEVTQWDHRAVRFTVPSGTTSMKLQASLIGNYSARSGAEPIYIDNLTLCDITDMPMQKQQAWSLQSVATVNDVTTHLTGSGDPTLDVDTGRVYVDYDSGAVWTKTSDSGSAGWVQLMDKTVVASLHRSINNAQVASQTLTDRVSNGAFTGSATGWDLSGGWAYGTNNVYITGGVISGAVLAQTITEIHSGSEYTVTADLGGFTANEEVELVFETLSGMTVILGTYTAAAPISTGLLIPESGTTTSGFLTFTLSNSSGTAAVYVDNVTMTLTSECLRQSPIDTFWPAGTLTQMGDAAHAIWRGGVDANTPDLSVVIIDDGGNATTLWSHTVIGTGDFELDAQIVYNTTTTGKAFVRFLQDGQAIDSVSIGFSNVIWASEGCQLQFIVVPDATGDVVVDYSEYKTELK